MDAIIINGAPGVGKSTVADGLKLRLGWPVLELGYIRMAYLDPQWTTANAAEAQMSFEVQCYAVRRFVQFGLKNTMLVDLLPEHVAQIAQRLAGLDYRIVTLVVTDQAVHRARVLEPSRDSGFRDVEKAWARNNSLRSRPPLPREILLDTTREAASETIQRVLAAVERGRDGSDEPQSA